MRKLSAQSDAAAVGSRRLVLAVGTASGSVVAYDASAAEQVWRTRALPDGCAGGQSRVFM